MNKGLPMPTTCLYHIIWENQLLYIFCTEASSLADLTNLAALAAQFTLVISNLWLLHVELLLVATPVSIPSSLHPTVTWQQPGMPDSL